MASWDEWITEVTTGLGLPADCIDPHAVLDLTRDVAHSVDRPSAPLTAYLAGVAVGRGADPTTALAAIRALLPPPPPVDAPLTRDPS